jgi:hypothetical protein
MLEKKNRRHSSGKSKWQRPIRMNHQETNFSLNLKTTQKEFGEKQ